MSKSVKRFRKYNEEYEGRAESYDHTAHLKEKRMTAALRSKTKAGLLDILEDY